MLDIIIVGAGPAGLTAAIYARRALKNVLVLESMTYGGQIINSLDIENYPAAPHITGVDFANQIYNQAKELGADISFEKAEEIKDLGEYKEVITNKNTYQAKAVILATGASCRKLGVEREEEMIGKGISYCATCDGNFFKGKDVAVVGGGNTALEDALYLSNLVNKVYLIHRRDEFRGESSKVEQLKKKENVEMLYFHKVVSLVGENVLEEIVLEDKEGNRKNIPVSGLFIAIGRTPENDSYQELISLDELGYVLAEENCHTNIPGIFVAGDNRQKELRQLVTATSDGAIAANEAIHFLNQK